jgi:subtilase family serine protease
MRRFAIVAGVLALLLCGSASAFSVEQSIILAGNHPVGVENLIPSGRAEPSRALRLSISFAPRNRGELGQLLTDLQDPNSPRFHRWLTPAQFNRRFGPADGDVNAVVDWLHSEGFKVLSLNRPERYVSFTGTVDQAESAFAVSIATFDKSQLFANVNDPVIPTRLAGVISGIHGLDNMLRAEPLTRIAGRPASATAPSGGETYPVSFERLASFETAQPDVKIKGQGPFFGPSDLKTFYNIEPLRRVGITGGGRDCLAIVGVSNFRTTAIKTFNRVFSLPRSRITETLASGNDPGITIDEDESLLDLEASHAVAPGAAQYFYMGDPAHAVIDPVVDALGRAVSDNACAVISVSFGICGALPSFFTNTVDPIAAQAAAQGQSVFVGAGDFGADTCFLGVRNVNELSADPNVTSVGGTEFSPGYNARGNDVGFVTEFVWNDSAEVAGGGATGGGRSQIFAKPAYQAGSTPADGWRDVPDVAMIASAISPGFTVVFDNNGPVVGTVAGGTSLSTQVFAGIAKLVEQKSGQRLGNMNPQIYQLAAAQELGGSGAPDNGFRDVTSGDNTIGVAGFEATIGFDLATGWGSVDAAKFVIAYTSAGLPGSRR